MQISPTFPGGTSLPSGSQMRAWLCIAGTPHEPTFANDWYCSRTLATVGGPNDCGLRKGIALKFEDKTSSVANGTARWWKLFEDRGYKGYVLCLRPGGYDSDLGNNTPQEDDISSVRIQGTGQPRGCDQVIG